MGNITLFTGAAGSYYYFRDKIIDHISAGQYNEYLYILPVNRAVRYLKKNLVKKSNLRALADPPVYTFPDLIRKLYSIFPDSKKIVSKSTRLLFLKQIFEDHLDELDYIKPQNRMAPGLITKTDTMLSELIQFGYWPGNFGPPPESSGPKYEDLKKLLIYLSANYGNEFIDEAMLINEVNSGITNEYLEQVFPGLQKIYINGYGIYTPPMIDLIDKLGQHYAVEIKLEYDSENPGLFLHTYNAYDSLKKIADRVNQIEGNTDTLNKNLFTGYKSEQSISEISAKFEIHKMLNRDEEIRYIAADIRELFQQGIPLHRIGVTFPDLEKYAHKIRQTMVEFEIPFNLSTGFSLAQSPLVQTCLQVLKIRISGFDVHEVRKLLISSFISPELRVNLNQFNKLVSLLNIQRFYDNWEISITDSEWYAKEESEPLISAINYIRSEISRLTYQIDYGDITIEYLRVLDKLGILDWFNREELHLSRLEREREFRAYNRFYKLLNQINLLPGTEKSSLRDFVDNLYLILKDVSFNLREWSNYGVQFMPRLEIQSLECDVLFVGGLVEGEFPRAFHRDIFFNDDERHQLGLYAVEDLLAQDRYLFYQLLSSAGKVILVYPSYDGETSLLPSSFIRNLSEVTGIRESDENDSANYYLNRNNFPEHLAKSVRTETTESDIKLLQGWITQNSDGRDEMTSLFNGINILDRKADRSHFSAFEGILSGNNNIVTWLKNDAREKTFSITALELYAFCPIKYFIKRILKLEEEEEEVQFTAMDRGVLIHNILFKFFIWLKQNNKTEQPWKYPEILQKIAREKIESLPFSGLSWTLEKEIMLGNGFNTGVFKKFLNVEHEEIIHHQFLPKFFEFAFGLTSAHHEADLMSRKKPLVIKDADMTVKLSGKIDRIDVDREGNILIIDYKTGRGKNAGIKDIASGRSLQLPVYMEAVKQLMPDLFPVAGVYYQVHNQDNCKRTVAILDAENKPDLLKRGDGRLPNNKYPYKLNDLISQSMTLVLEGVKGIMQGDFKHTPDPDHANCQTYCRFKMICRKDVAKIKAAN